MPFNRTAFSLERNNIKGGIQFEKGVERMDDVSLDHLEAARLYI